jgi:hypothetical protein
MREFIAIILFAAFIGYVAQLPGAGKGPRSSSCSQDIDHG